MSNPITQIGSGPGPVEVYEVPLEAVPPPLDGMRILHLSDLHVSAGVEGRASWKDLLAAIERTPADLALLTGDFMTRAGDEEPALRALAHLLRHVRCRVGVWGVFGNHDTPEFQRRAAEMPGVSWLVNRGEDVRGLPLRLIGASEPEDPLAAAASLAEPEPGRFCLGVAHTPSMLFAFAALGVPMVAMGHTHGGQVRLSPRRIGYTAGEVPGTFANGVVRVGGTIGCISRGLGTGRVRLRLNCPAQAPVYVLRRGPTACSGAPAERLLAW